LPILVTVFATGLLALVVCTDHSKTR